MTTAKPAAKKSATPSKNAAPVVAVEKTIPAKASPAKASVAKPAAEKPAPAKASPAKAAPAKATPAKAKVPAKAPAKKAAAKSVARKAEAPVAAADFFALPKFELPSFDMPKFELPENPLPDMMRDMAEQSVANARETYDKTKASFDEQQSAVEKSVETAMENATNLNKKALDAAQANIAAGFDFARDIMTARTFGDVIEMQTSFARKQFDAVAEQNKDFQDTLTKSVEEASAPVKKALENFKAA